MSTATIVRTDEFERALHVLDSGGHLFLTGKAGTGKSTLIRHFMAHTDRRVVVAAPTGIAALNVDGYTIHRLFGFGTTTSLDKIRSGKSRPGGNVKVINTLQTLIIDEASMVRADLFDMMAATLERYGPQPGEPFGGVQIVLVGDLLQLPPVVLEAETEHFTTRYATPYFFSADSFDREAFPTIALTTVFRQVGDRRLTDALNAIREGSLLTDVEALLNARTDPGFEPPDDDLWLTLAPTNRSVRARNHERLVRLEGEKYTVHAVRAGDLDDFEPPADEELSFKVGAQIMMLNNDSGGRWVNGTIGRIETVSYHNGELVVSAQFRDGTSAEFGPHTWEVTRPVADAGSLRNETVGTFTQLPFKLAWAITIHKSQGQTLDHLVVDLAGGAFDFGQVYVALSRCTSLDGLVLTRPVRARDLKTDRRVRRFLRETSNRSGRQRYCGIGVLTVGRDGIVDRRRPIEVAVAFDDGTAISTLINPQRDLGDARTAYGIGVTDILLAPTLAQAWATLGPLLEGFTPVGVGTDEVLSALEGELKHFDVVEPFPVGIDLPPGVLTSQERLGLQAGNALDRARAALSVFTRVGDTDSDDGGFGEYGAGDACGCLLLTRDSAVTSPNSPTLPNLSALLHIGRAVGAVLRDGATTAEPAPDSAGAALPEPIRHAVEQQLTSAINAAVSIPSDLATRLRAVDRLLGTAVAGIAEGRMGASADHATLFVPGARVCFTGTVIDRSGTKLSKDDLRKLAEACGLIWVESVTKKKCDVLVVAEAGTQSGKAKAAIKCGTPVVLAADFLASMSR
ncbi:AAA family ATPase [Pilimelia terevasa]|uniref:AAA family ATPase n=1 Tax=Pilimelia terevasa TaxID=53372 RepID=UPI001E4D713C|nr:AAA family ATPase [Pilimelia terevasa]